MPEIQIDREKAERLIAQILREEKKLQPAEANDLAANMCRRLYAAMPIPPSRELQGYRMIKRYPPDGFATALGEKIADVNEFVGRELWEMVYDRGRDLPPTLSDPASVR